MKNWDYDLCAYLLCRQFAEYSNVLDAYYIEFYFKG